ncbi:tetratricopeptide repeat protein [bacterium]|nr:tetratricopeptide repeat protein [bacterium]
MRVWTLPAGALLVLALQGCSTPTAGSTDHYNRGVQLFLSDPDAAEKEFRAAIKDNPNNEFAHNQLGRLYFTRKRYSEAVTCFQHAVRIQPNNLDFLENLARAAVMSGDPALAEGSYKRAMQLAPKVAAYPYNLGLLAERAGRTEEAAVYYRKAIEADPFFTQARSRLLKLNPNQILP